MNKEIKENILIIDDSLPFLNDVEILLGEKFTVLTAQTAKKGLEILKNSKASAVLLDLKLPDMFGTEVLKKILKDIDPYLPVIIVTDYGDIEIAVEAMQHGAVDFIQKDFNRDILHSKIIKALEKRQLEISVDALKSNISLQYDEFVYSSEIMRKFYLDIYRVAMHNVDVLIQGETGVGKDLSAFHIHKNSKRKDDVFLTIPLNNFSESLIESELFGYEKGSFTNAEKARAGKFEAANGGTIYLPEISEISERLQLKLLQFMQYKTISRVGSEGKNIKLDVRIIMATNVDLKQLVAEKKIREDFYYRITVMPLTVPPLRERKDDIPVIANHFLKKFSIECGKRNLSFSPETIHLLKEHIWSGNVRELSNSIYRAVVLSDNSEIIQPSLFPEITVSESEINYTSEYQTYKAAESIFRRSYFKELLEKTGGNKTKAAGIAGLSRQGLIKILKELDID